MFVALLCCLFIVDVSTGPSWLPARDVVTALFWPYACSYKSYVIVWVMRLPVAIMALLVGASLGAAGAEMQTILDNPLASPFTLGISAAASFGAALALVAGSRIPASLQILAVPLLAFVFALVSSSVMYVMAKTRRSAPSSIILAGIAVSFLFSSFVSILQYVATDDALKGISNWINGNLIGANWEQDVIVLSIFMVVLPFLIVDAWKLTSLRLGDGIAKSLGINVERLRTKVLVLISVLTATAVCFVGTIGFVGLVAPHVARSLIGEDQRFYLPFSILSGAAMLSFSSMLSKVVMPGAVIPVGIITSIIGVPFLLLIILKKG